jgi:nucleoside-diphosphate-sugar epimerase
MTKILIIGGTRNMGYSLLHRLAEQGHDVTILNRGREKVDLPANVYRLHADRTDPKQMQRALLGKSFDVVVDFVLFAKEEAQTIVHLLRDRVQHYIFVSTGQVYLVREDIERPFSEHEYEGRLKPPPKELSFAREEWNYGMTKRESEDVFRQAYADHSFPFTSLRLPMVNSERDPFKRLYNYILRLKDGGPILVPETPNYALRHVYGEDVVAAIDRLIDSGLGKGEAFNICQDETVTIDEFVGLLADILRVEPHICRAKRSQLIAEGFLPDCSPFSEHWMSELTNEKSKRELGMTYTALPTYLEQLVRHYESDQPPEPVAYRRRRAEIDFAERQSCVESAT